MTTCGALLARCGGGSATTTAGAEAPCFAVQRINCDCHCDGRAAPAVTGIVGMCGALQQRCVTGGRCAQSPRQRARTARGSLHSRKIHVHQHNCGGRKFLARFTNCQARAFSVSPERSTPRSGVDTHDVTARKSRRKSSSHISKGTSPAACLPRSKYASHLTRHSPTLAAHDSALYAGGR
jgi:hypothetical protein